MEGGHSDVAGFLDEEDIGIIILEDCMGLVSALVYIDQPNLEFVGVQH